MQSFSLPLSKWCLVFWRSTRHQPLHPKPASPSSQRKKRKLQRPPLPPLPLLHLQQQPRQNQLLKRRPLRQQSQRKLLLRQRRRVLLAEGRRLLAQQPRAKVCVRLLLPYAVFFLTISRYVCPIMPLTLIFL